MTPPTVFPVKCAATQAAIADEPAPTLAEFEAMVAKHEIHYYVGRGANSFGGGAGSSAIAAWVAAHFTGKTVGGVTVYDLTQQE